MPRAGPVVWGRVAFSRGAVGEACGNWLADSRDWLLVGGLVYLLGRPKLFGASLTRTLRLVDWKLCRDD